MRGVPRIVQEIQRGMEGRKEGREREGKLRYSYKEMILSFHATSFVLNAKYPRPCIVPLLQ